MPAAAHSDAGLLLLARTSPIMVFLLSMVIIVPVRNKLPHLLKCYSFYHFILVGRIEFDFQTSTGVMDSVLSSVTLHLIARVFDG